MGFLGASKFSTTLIDRRLDSSTRPAHHLEAHRRIAAGGTQSLVPRAAVMNANGGADAGHKRRLENRLMVRRRDPYRSRRRGSGVRRTFESMLRSRINIAARPLGIAAISRP